MVDDQRLSLTIKQSTVLVASESLEPLPVRPKLPDFR